MYPGFFETLVIFLDFQGSMVDYILLKLSDRVKYDRTGLAPAREVVANAREQKSSVGPLVKLG
jgi:hypothetical protein